MRKIKYLIVEKKDGGWYWIPTRVYNSFLGHDIDSTDICKSSLEVLQRLGKNGWELMDESSTEMRFKRVVEDNPSEQLAQLRNTLGNIANEIAEINYKETLRLALLQDLVEKLYPESKALAALKLEFEGVEKSEVKPNECKKEPVVIDPEIDAQTKKFADEHVEEQLDGYEDSDKSLELFTIIVGFSRLLPLQTIDSHHRYMIEALYRFYNKNPNDKIKDCYIRAINRMALYLSTPDTISQLNEIAKTSMTIEEATDAFFNIAIKQLAFEKDGTAPFVVNEMEEFLQIFVKQIKENPELSEDKDLTAKIRKYANHILQEYALNCGDLL